MFKPDSPTLRTRFIAILIAGSLILVSAVSCQQPEPPLTDIAASNTPTISSTFTASPAPTYPTSKIAPVISTRTPSATHSPILLSTPQYSLTNYHLRPWLENDSTTLVNRTLNLDYSQWDPSNLDKGRLTFEVERLIRFPNSSQWYDWAWETAKIDPHGIPLPEMRPNQTYFSFLVEHLLNQEDVRPEQLPGALDKYGYRISNDSIIQVDNLFGDGQKDFVFIAKIFTLKIFGEFRGVFGVHRYKSEYRAETLMDWEIFHMPSFWLGDSLQAVGDINGNGIAEIIVEEDAFWSAMSGDATDTKFLNIFEWHSTQQAFENYHFIVYEQHCGDPPNCKDRWEWKFGEKDGQGTRPLIVTKFAIQESDPIGQVIQVTNFPWSELSQHLVRTGNNVDSNQDQITIAVQNVERIFFQKRDFPAMIARIEELLAVPPLSINIKLDSNRPYLRYLLGLAYELNVQSPQAVSTYYQLWLDNPSDIFGVAASFKLEVNR